MAHANASYAGSVNLFGLSVKREESAVIDGNSVISPVHNVLFVAELTSLPYIRDSLSRSMILIILPSNNLKFSPDNKLH